MIAIEEKVYWLQHIIDQKKQIIANWRFRARMTNICDNMGINPIDKLSYEIKIAQELIDLCNLNK